MRALVYINTTGNEIVDKQVEKILEGCCKARGYDAFAVYGEDTDRCGMSEPTRFMTVGMAVTRCTDRVVTLFGEMVGNSREDILTKLHKLDMFGIQMETVLDDLDDHYEEIYRIESENEGMLAWTSLFSAFRNSLTQQNNMERRRLCQLWQGLPCEKCITLLFLQKQ